MVDSVSALGFANVLPVVLGSGQPTQLALAGALDPLAASGDSAIVELSTLGRELSATSSFGSQLQELQGELGAAIANPGTGVAEAASAARGLVDAFNNVQASLAGVGGAGAGQIAGSFNALAQGEFANGGSTLTRLAQIGIVPAAETGRLALDAGTLQTAFGSDQAGTLGLLNQAISQFSAQAQDFVGQTGGEFNALSSEATQPGISAPSFSGTGLLFGGVTPLAGGSSGLVDLLTLGAATQNAATPVTPQQILLALNQFSLVSSLLG